MDLSKITFSDAADVPTPSISIALAPSPRRRGTKRPTASEAFHAPFERQMRRDLKPRGPLEGLVVDRLIRAAWRLQKENPDAALRPAEVKAERSLLGAVAILARLRKTAAWGEAAPLVTHLAVAPDLDPEPDFGPPSYVSGRSDEPIEAEYDDEDDDSIDLIGLWRNRLVFDPEVSERSPVVQGTWITVNHVVSLIVDGWAWADILKTHPELTEGDIRACVAYTVEEEGPHSAA